MKTSSEIIDAIQALEQRFPVDRWRCGETDLWPSYRFRLYGNAIDRALLTQAPPAQLGRLRRLADRAARALWRVPIASWRDRRANAAVQPGQTAVFFSDGVSFSQLDNHWFDRIIDPVAQVMEAQGLQTLKLTPLSEAHIPRWRPSRFVQPAIDRIKFTSTRHRPSIDLPEFEAFEEAAREHFGTGTPSRDWLQVQAARLDALATWFQGQLQRTGARLVFVNTYYSLEGQAFVQAARREGRLSIDLQHGMQGPHHAAYARWARCPASGYSTVPDEFWVWGAEEASVIAAWSGQTRRHRPRVVGNYWLQRWQDDSDPLIAACIAQAQALRHPAAVHVLACLSWGLADEETEKLIQAARQCAKHVVWWWRLHPVESARRSQFAARLAHNGLDGSLVGTTTDLPLYALVRSAEVAVAHSSTVIQEAAALGIPSVVTSDYGAELHAALVHAGTAIHATSAQDIAAAVQTQVARPPMAILTSATSSTLPAAVAAAMRRCTRADQAFEAIPA